MKKFFKMLFDGMHSIGEGFASLNMFPPPLPPLFTDEEIDSIRNGEMYGNGLERDTQALRSDWEKVLGPDLKGVNYEQQDDKCSSEASKKSQETSGTSSSRKEKSE